MGQSCESPVRKVPFLTGWVWGGGGRHSQGAEMDDTSPCRLQTLPGGSQDTAAF